MWRELRKSQDTPIYDTTRAMYLSSPQETRYLIDLSNENSRALRSIESEYEIAKLYKNIAQIRLSCFYSV